MIYSWNTAKCYQETPDISLPAMRHILKKPWCHEKHLASILDELFKAWFHHQCDPSCWICSTIHVLEEISWDTAREAATTCNNMQQPCHTVHPFDLQKTGPNRESVHKQHICAATGQDSVCLMPLLGKNMKPQCSCQLWCLFDMLDIFDLLFVSACFCNLSFIHTKEGVLGILFPVSNKNWQEPQVWRLAAQHTTFQLVSFWASVRNYAE